MKRYNNHNASFSRNRHHDVNNRERNMSNNFNRRDNDGSFNTGGRYNNRNDSTSRHRDHHPRNRSPHQLPPPSEMNRRSNDDSSASLLNISEIAGSLSSASNPNQITTILASAINAAFLAGTMNTPGNPSSIPLGNAFNRSGRNTSPKRHQRDRQDSGHSRNNNNNNLHEINEVPTRTLFVGNLDRSISQRELRDIFEEFGLVEDVDIKSSGGDKAYAFIRYQNMDIAGRARRALQNRMIGKLSIRIAYGKMMPSRCIWIGNLGPWLNYRQLLTYIERYSRPEKVVWSSGKSYAHALFRSIAVATDVADSIRGYVFPGSERPLKVDFIDDTRMLKTVQNRYQRGRDVRQDMDHKRRYSSDRDSYSRGRGVRRDSSSPLRIRRRDSNGPMYDQAKSSKRPHTPFSLTPDGDESDSGRISDVTSEIDKVHSAKTWQDLVNTLPSVWRGQFSLKTCFYGCEMYLIKGDVSIINRFMMKQMLNESQDSILKNGNNCSNSTSGEPKTPPEEGEQIDDDDDHPCRVSQSKAFKSIDLMITQRMKMEASKLDDFKEQLIDDKFCLLLATERNDNKDRDSNNFRSLPNLVNYLKEKDAAGIVMLDNEKSFETKENNSALLHVFPPCSFAVSLIQRYWSKFERNSNANTDKYLLIAIVKDV